MTGTREPQQEGPIQAMLHDAGLEASTELRRCLEELSAVVPDRAPAPRADLAALLALPSVPASGEEPLPAGVTSLAERRGRKRRLAVVSGAVLGAMTLGAGAVAASSEAFRENVGHTVGTIFQPPAVTADTAPKPARPSPADIPAAPVPSKAPGDTTAPAAADDPAAPGPVPVVPAEPGAAATPPAAVPDRVLPTPSQRTVTPETLRLPGSSGDRGIPAVPLPAPTFPGVLPVVPGQP
ncbi:hypothetical protein [Arthrobacter sp. AL12]|uniref:hypothetical protein n=1 Tax=Arthrobacter sp. AL12 TaxID=3042241 RepID=UPI002499D68D|nr:hypothetical protein [Arthrobacter sp. AL12]MDI3210601.1 hypothetical protein [Arthrobacter sp. AL12]